MALDGILQICRPNYLSHSKRYFQLAAHSGHANAQYQWDYASSYFYLLTLLGYKFSILLLYLRLFSVSVKFRYATWAVMFFVFGYLFSNLLTQIFGCTPIQLSWKLEAGHCINLLEAGVAFSSMNVISDLLIFVLPMPMVWRLQLSRKVKLGVMLVFMGGGM